MNEVRLADMWDVVSLRLMMVRGLVKLGFDLEDVERVYPLEDSEILLERFIDTGRQTMDLSKRGIVGAMSSAKEIVLPPGWRLVRDEPPT